ncbi:hypothetical protein [Providencia huaxiensis]|uniref:hypothetical protein n=1 Tax=Providencia huaxiensis TaxID=2027290 RepID=UPI0034E58F89
MRIILRKNDTNIVSSDTLAMMIQKKGNKDNISEKSKNLIVNEIKRLIQANSEESLKSLNEGRLSLASINSDKVKRKLRKYFPNDIRKINNNPIVKEANYIGGSIKTPAFEVEKKLTPKTIEKKSEEKINKNIEVVDKQLNNQNIKETDPGNMGTELQLKIALATDSSIKEVNQCVMSYLSEKGIEKDEIKECLKLIQKLNKSQGGYIVKETFENAFKSISPNEKDSKYISHIFIDQLKYKLSGAGKNTHDKATSTTDLTNLYIDNILNDTCLSDKVKLTIPMELKGIIDEAVERNYLSEINLVEVKSLLQKMKRDETSEAYSLAIGYLKYGINFPIGSNNEKKINKVIHEMESPSVKHRILNFFMDMKFKILRLYNNLF